MRYYYIRLYLFDYKINVVKFSEVVAVSKKNKRKKNTSKGDYKRFPVVTLEDGMLVLGSLINDVIVNLTKYKNYADEVYELCEKYNRISSESNKEVIIPAAEYDNINDKLLFRQREILKFISDCSKDSFSYNMFRKQLVKNQLLTASIDENVSKLLTEFLDVRNWTFHNPQSRLVATSEVAQNSIPSELKGVASIQPQINPLIITHTSDYDLIMLISLSLHVKKRAEQFELVLTQMKTDYEEMYEKIGNKPIYIRGPRDTSKVIYYERSIPMRFISPATDVSQLSMAIQKSKYDGTVDKYNKWVLNKI